MKKGYITRTESSALYSFPSGLKICCCLGRHRRVIPVTISMGNGSLVELDFEFLKISRDEAFKALTKFRKLHKANGNLTEA